MKIRSDYSDVMKTQQRQLVETFEAALEGRNVEGEDPFVAALADGLRSHRDRPAPVATGPLQVLLTQGLAPEVIGASSSLNDDAPAGTLGIEFARRSSVASVAVTKILGLTLIAKVALASVAFAAGTAGVGVAGALPAPMQAAFNRVASIVQDAVEPTDQQPVNSETQEGFDGDTSARRPDGKPQRRDGGVRELIDRHPPADRDRQFGRDVADDVARNRSDDAVRGDSRPSPEPDPAQESSGVRELVEPEAPLTETPNPAPE